MAKNQKSKKHNDETILSKTADMLVKPEHSEHQYTDKQPKHNAAKQKKQQGEFKN